ncbi:urease accessory protein UreD [Sulfitobacter sp. PS-8MA]|uniref:urease accessory protein UreD n=1 Tax=Sulfitobacter sp. PS-8MA TaxID=3237707 RepID=UPI0034C673B2
MYDSSLRDPDKLATGAMFAHARLSTLFSGRSSHVDVLRSDGPLVLRKSNPKGPEPLTQRRTDIARVALAAGTAGPLGGDAYALNVEVGAGSTLLLQEVSAMLVLPGIGGGQSRMSVTVNVAAGATFVWWAEPIIAAQRCHHLHELRINLAADARLVLREELLLGRHGEEPGDFSSRLRITRANRALYDQRLSFGPATQGWDGAAVLDGNRAAGSILVVDPDWGDAPPSARPYHQDAALAPLPGPGVAIAAAAPDSLALRGLLHDGLNILGAPWAI